MYSHGNYLYAVIEDDSFPMLYMQCDTIGTVVLSHQLLSLSLFASGTASPRTTHCAARSTGSSSNYCMPRRCPLTIRARHPHSTEPLPPSLVCVVMCVNSITENLFQTAILLFVISFTLFRENSIMVKLPFGKRRPLMSALPPTLAP